MSRRSWTRIGDRLSPGAARRLLNLAPQTRNTGLRVVSISKDFRTWRFELPLRLRNRNYFGSHHGGMLYASADPHYVLAFTRILGRGYVVWSKESTIRFVRPGKGTLHFDFHIDEAESDEVKRLCEPGAGVTRQYEWVWRDEAGQAVAEIDQTIYFRKKPPRD